MGTAMLLSRLQPPLRAALTSIARSATGGTQTTCLNEAFAQLTIRPRPGTAGGVRWASHKAQGAVNKAKDDQERDWVQRNLENNMSSQATSSSANGVHIGFPVRTAPWAAITPSTPRITAM